VSRVDVEAGTLLEARADTPAAGIVHWEAPLSTGFDGVVTAGTRLRVIESLLPGATAIGCLPLAPNLEAVIVPLSDRRAEKYAGFHLVIPLTEIGERWRVLDSLGPERTLLEAVRVLHGRGAHGIQVVPYHYATGHWRCSFMIGGVIVDALKYTSGRGWMLPGREDATPTDPEGEADAIWAALDDDLRAKAENPDSAYVFWFSAILDRCHDRMLPTLWDDDANHLNNGYLRLGGFVEKAFERTDFPLPPGDALTRLGV